MPKLIQPLNKINGSQKRGLLPAQFSASLEFEKTARFVFYKTLRCNSL